MEIISSKTEENSPSQDSQRTVALLPGSREKEVKKHLPIMLKSINLIRKDNLRFVVIKHPQLHLSLFVEAQKENISLVEVNHYETLSKAYIAITSSGTATLELALLGIPSVAIYKMGWLTFLILKNMVKVNYISIVNIIAKEKIFPEFIQSKASPKNIASACEEFLNNRQFHLKTKEKLKKIRDVLGTKSASENAASQILGAIQK